MKGGGGGGGGGACGGGDVKGVKLTFPCPEVLLMLLKLSSFY